MGMPGGDGLDGLEIEIEMDPEEGVIDIEVEEIESFDINLVDKLDEKDLRDIADEVKEAFDADLLSRKDWLHKYAEGLKFLGLKYEKRSEPWEGACGVTNPMITEAAIRFQSEVITETFPAAGPVKTKIVGEETPERIEASLRVAEDMNYRLLEEMTEYRAEHERLLWSLAIAGAAFKKVYFDPNLDRQVSIFCPAEDVVIPYGASNLETAERVSHIMRKTKFEVEQLMKLGFYAEAELADPVSTPTEVERAIAETTGEEGAINSDDRYVIIEVQTYLDISDDCKEKGERLMPYVVTIEKDSETVLAIRRNYNERTRQKMTHFVQYNYVPGFGAYGMGLIHLIGAYAESATSLTRQLVDAGTLSNLPGGLKSRGLRMNKGDEGPIKPGEFRDVDVPGNAIRDNILPLPYKEPSPTLYNLLGDVVNEGRNFVSASDLDISDMSGQAPVGTTLALLERKLKVTSAIQSRIHFSMKQELKLLKNIIRDCMPDDYAYDPEGGDRSVKKADYDMCEVIPVSDPNASTMAHKVIQFQTVTQMAQQAPPGTYDMKMLHRQALEAIGVKNAEKLVPLSEDAPNMDPVSENEAILTSKPIKAYMEQDHEAHIAVHAALLQDPQIQQFMANNPAAQMIMSQLQAHLAAHYAMKFRLQVEQQMGMPIPTVKEGESMPTEIESAVSRMAAQATQQVLLTNQQRAAQEQALAQAQDPVIQMQQQELMLEEKKVQQKDRELDIKEKQLQVDAAHKADQTDIARENIASREEIAGMQAGSRMAAEKDRLEAQQELDGVRAGIDIAKSIAQETGKHAERADKAAERSQRQKERAGKPPAGRKG